MRIRTCVPTGAPANAGLARTDLTGEWRAAVADDSLRRTFPTTSFDDSGWEPVQVPGYWQSVPTFAGSDGPLLYRRSFESSAPVDDERVWLVFDGIFYQGDVWLDGSYVGDTEGWFFPQSFDVTERLEQEGEHVVAVEVGCNPVGHGPAGRGLLGIWDDPSWATPGHGPGGIWGPVRLERTGPVRLSSLRVSCREAGEKRAVVELAGMFDSSVATTAEISIVARAPSPVVGAPGEIAAHLEAPLPLAAGVNRSRWRLEVPEPRLWWPWGMGEQDFYQLDVSVRVDDRRSDGRCLRTGLRQVRMRDMRWSINGEAAFLMGAELVPPGSGVGLGTAAEATAQVDRAMSDGLNMVRPRAHVAHPALYEHADEVGMLVWQDLPLHGRYRGQRRQATAQAQRLPDVLGHHPCVVAWCAHDYPAGGSARRRVAASLRGLVLDRAVRRSLERADPSRPALASPGPFPGPRWARRGPGGEWPVGRPAGLPLAAVMWPASYHFVRPVPVPGGRTQQAGRPQEVVGAREVVRSEGDAGSQAAGAVDGAGQGQAAEVLRRQVEALRRLNWHPVGGFCLERLPDGQDAEAALRQACAPVIVTATWPGGPVLPGPELTFDLHIMTAAGRSIAGATLEAVLRWPGGGRRWTFAGDACAGTTFVGRTRARAQAPHGPVPGDAGTGTAGTSADGWVELELELKGPSGLLMASNRYRSVFGVP